MTTALDIPCKRPVVTVTSGGTFGTNLSYVVVCHVPGCRWTYGPAVRTDADDHAKWHRSAHRAAVPQVDGHACECGWQPTVGTVTKTDRDVSLTYHLTTAHGLVSCS